MRRPLPAAAVILSLASATSACATFGGPQPRSVDAARTRTSVLARSALWAPTRIRSLAIVDGPPARDAIPFRATVTCDYVETRIGGKSPKFLCKTRDGRTIKVKYGADNGEVYGEVLATRLLWALGFGADRMYPAQVVCRGCPAALGGDAAPGSARRFDPAIIERPMAGAEWPADDAPGWAWNELNVVNPVSGGATLAQRDALKLLAVFLQHTDSKPEQQRILCLGDRKPSASGACRRPFLMISDVGLTFGHATRMNGNDAAANLAAWRAAPIWKDADGCRGNLPRSLTGTLDDPVISEDGRRFLAGLMAQLSDRQIADLFKVAQVETRLRAPGDASSGRATVAEWVAAFKAKRAEIAGRRCL